MNKENLQKVLNILEEISIPCNNGACGLSDFICSDCQSRLILREAKVLLEDIIGD